MPKLTFDEFSRANEARKKQFFKNSDVDNWSVADAFMAMIGELGETANALKKVRRAELGMHNKNKPGRQIDNLDDAKAQVAGEIGGFMCYLDQLCVQIGLRLEDCIVDEFNKKSVELDFPERISDGVFMLAMKGKIKAGNNEYDGELLYEPPQERPVAIHMTADDPDAADVYAAVKGQSLGVSAEQFAADVERTKYRDSWAEAQNRRKMDRRVGKHPGLGAPYGEQPFNERHVEGPNVEPLQWNVGDEMPEAGEDWFKKAKRVLKIPAADLRSEHSFTYRFGGPAEIDRLEIRDTDISPEVRVYNFDEPVRLSNGLTYIFGVDRNDQPFCRPLVKRPTVWTDGCALCRWCAMEPDCDPYCTNPTVGQAAATKNGVGLNRALQTCGPDGFLRLFEPRK